MATNTAQAGDNAKKALADALNGVLADHYALYLKTKNFHWHVSGPRFRSLHLLFDEQAGQLIGVTDAIAERVRKFGGTTLTSVGSIAEHSAIKDQDSTTLEPEAMVRELRDDNATLVDRIREAKKAAADAGDNATEGMADDWTDAAEERVWFLNETLQ